MHARAEVSHAALLQPTQLSTQAPAHAEGTCAYVQVQRCNPSNAHAMRLTSATSQPPSVAGRHTRVLSLVPTSSGQPVLEPVQYCGKWMGGVHSQLDCCALTMEAGALRHASCNHVAAGLGTSMHSCGYRARHRMSDKCSSTVARPHLRCIAWRVLQVGVTAHLAGRCKALDAGTVDALGHATGPRDRHFVGALLVAFAGIGVGVAEGWA